MDLNTALDLLYIEKWLYEIVQIMFQLHAYRRDIMFILGGPDVTDGYSLANSAVKQQAWIEMFNKHMTDTINYTASTLIKLENTIDEHTISSRKFGVKYHVLPVYADDMLATSEAAERAICYSMVEIEYGNNAPPVEVLSFTYGPDINNFLNHYNLRLKRTTVGDLFRQILTEVINLANMNDSCIKHFKYCYLPDLTNLIGKLYRIVYRYDPEDANTEISRLRLSVYTKHDDDYLNIFQDCVETVEFEDSLDESDLHQWGGLCS